MTLEEAIAHAEEQSKSALGEDDRDQHRQLAEWLKELRVARSNGTGKQRVSTVDGQMVDSALYGWRPVPEAHEVCVECQGEGVIGSTGCACACARYGKHPGFQRVPGPCKKCGGYNKVVNGECWPCHACNLDWYW